MPVKTKAQREREAAEERANPSGKGWRNAVPAKRYTEATKMTRSKLFRETMKLHEKIATLELSGVSLAEIAMQLRLTKKELNRHRAEPVYQSMLKQGADLTKKRLETKLDSLTDQALDVHGEIMRRPKKGDPIRLAAASSVLDRTIAKPRELAPQDARPVSEHHLHLHADPTEVATVAKRFRAAAILAGHLPGEITAPNPAPKETVDARSADPRDPVEAEAEAVEP
jgi:hypothetical protein